MITRQLVCVCVALSSLMASPVGPSVRAATPPTPPPCSPDGHCAPQAGSWGYHKVKWRKWPGTEHLDAPSGPAGGPQLGPVDKPRPEVEDQTAPPRVEGIEPQPRESEFEDTDGEFPRFQPPRPGEAPVRPDRLDAPRGVPQDDPNMLPDFLRGPTDAVPPGQPPLAPQRQDFPPAGPTEPTFRDPAGAGRDPGSDFFPDFRLQSHQEDAPPVLPFRATQRSQQLPPSVNTPSGPRRVDTQIRRTAHADDAPPQLPTVLRATFHQ